MRDPLAPVLPGAGEARPQGHRQETEVGTLHGAAAPAHDRTPARNGAPAIEFQPLEKFAAFGSTGWKILTPQLAALYCEEHRKQGRRVVFTNGCFDLFHAGHVASLEAARGLGDLLIVGLNSDASVRANKGDARPIIPQDQRAAILAALACVDAVVLFNEPTPDTLLAALRPAILAKGCEYTGQILAGAEYAGEVVLLPRDPTSPSTTAIIARCARLHPDHPVHPVERFSP